MILIVGTVFAVMNPTDVARYLGMTKVNFWNPTYDSNYSVNLNASNWYVRKQIQIFNNGSTNLTNGIVVVSFNITQDLGSLGINNSVFDKNSLRVYLIDQQGRCLIPNGNYGLVNCTQLPFLIVNSS